jgi:GT2 family glycosyltransferase/glycosyltransferase involved in cell wall biosynthesis
MFLSCLATLLCVCSFQADAKTPAVDILITLKTSRNFVEDCVFSVIRHKPNTEKLKQRVIFVDDGSPEETIQYTNSLCGKQPDDFVCLATAKDKPGYTFAVNIGIEHGETFSDAVVLLNSDTIVTGGWLEDLYAGLYSDPKIMIVSPLSNAASFQSIPEHTNKGPGGGWSINEYPPGMDVENFGRQVTEYAKETKMQPIPFYPLNGFCYMMKRELFTTVGLFDVINFPTGYGEEVDYSLKVHTAGFKQMIIPTVYVWHVKTASFSSGNKAEFKKVAKAYLYTQYGKERLAKLNTVGYGLTALDGVRNYTAKIYEDKNKEMQYVRYNASILFVLHELAIAGGIVSVLQEAWQMLKYGVNVSLAFPDTAKAEGVIRDMLPGISDAHLEALSRRYNGSLIDDSASIPDSFLNIGKDYDIVVATFYKTMRAVKAVHNINPKVMPAYYVQDYETWFLENPFDKLKTKNTKELDEVMSSYDEGTSFMISKTKWTAGMVTRFHNATVNMVVPSLDHTTYYPNNTELAIKLVKSNKFSVLHVIAMVRPRTIRRNALNTLEVALKLATNFPTSVKVTLFGCTLPWLDNAMKRNMMRLGKNSYRQKAMKDLPLRNVEFIGLLTDRKQIADFYRTADIFIDLSWWQAFGRTAMEAMATGCVAIMPLHGAASEICKGTREEGKYCEYHNGNDSEGYYKKLERLIEDDGRRHSMIEMAINRMQEFVVPNAAATITNQLKRGFKEYKEQGYKFAKPVRALAPP